MLWERLDVCTARFTRIWYKQVSATLESRSRGLIANKHLAEHVRIVNVVLTRCSTWTVLPPFSECLTLLPNLHTLQIVHAHSQMTTAIKNAFAGCNIPTVRTIILPSHAHNILRCCPNVQSVICTSDDGSKLICAINGNCNAVQSVEGFWLRETTHMKRFVKAVPLLQHITVRSDIPLETLILLSSLKRLRIIAIDKLKERAPQGIPSFDTFVDACSEILRKSPSKEMKRLYIRQKAAGRRDGRSYPRLFDDYTIPDEYEVAERHI